MARNTSERRTLHLGELNVHTHLTHPPAATSDHRVCPALRPPHLSYNLSPDIRPPPSVTHSNSRAAALPSRSFSRSGATRHAHCCVFAFLNYVTCAGLCYHLYSAPAFCNVSRQNFWVLCPDPIFPTNLAFFITQVFFIVRWFLGICLSHSRTVSTAILLSRVTKWPSPELLTL